MHRAADSTMRGPASGRGRRDRRAGRLLLAAASASVAAAAAERAASEPRHHQPLQAQRMHHSHHQQRQHQPPPRLRTNHSNQRRSLAASYCGGNWQDAYDNCNKPCTSGKDEECGPGLYCFNYIDCTPPAPAPEPSTSNGGGGGDVVNPWENEMPGSDQQAQQPPQFGVAPQTNQQPAPSPNQTPAQPPKYASWGGYPSADLGAPVLPPSEYMPTYIASLPVRPSYPTTPAPFVLPKPTPNMKSNPSKNYCGYGWESAMAECFHSCPSGKDDECPGGKTCHSWLTCTPSTVDPATYNVCGKNWAHAASKCSDRCFLGGDETCPPGETCFGGVEECGDKLPPLTAEDVGLAEKSYTEEEIKQLLDEEIAQERDAAAMENKNNWWCGTSWSNMLETCTQRCTSDADCKPNAWTDGYCFKTTGGPDNCHTPGVPVAQAAPPGSKWCGRSWNDMLETCDAKCETDEDCGWGRQCWVAPDTCQWVGVPVKEKSDAASLWCGMDYDDAMTGCHRACPGESDDECPSGMSCFSGSSCTTEGEPVVREGYRCGTSWEDASKECGMECQKNDDCDAHQECFAEVICESELLASQSAGMFCGTTWESTSKNCAERCEEDEDCPDNRWCYWVECEDKSAAVDAMREPTTEAPQASCNAEVKRCPNGQFVGRAVTLNCDFYPCPGGEDDEGAGGGGGEGGGGGGGGGGDTAQSSSGGESSNFASSDVDVSGWGSTPLAHACTSDTPGDCGLCEGDCNSDSDCKGGLMCFSRAQGESTMVPGCVSGGEGDKPGMDYCYTPFPPETTTTTTTVAASIEEWDESSVAELDYTRECTAGQPCEACQGDCDNESHCAGNLECYSRGIGSVEPVPGCLGLGVAGMDYCYDPNAPIVEAPTPGPTGALSCSAEVRVCRDGSFVYQDPDNNCLFPPCPISTPGTASKPAPTPATPPPTASSATPPTTLKPTADASTFYCGFSVIQVNKNCNIATPCPSGLDTECDGLEVCIQNTNCGAAAASPVTAGAVEAPESGDPCDSLCVDVLPSEWCPKETAGLNLPSCLEVSVGELCESDGECATSDALNNCGTYDIYARVLCGGTTASQGALMKGTASPTPGPTGVPTPLPTASPITSKPTTSPTSSLGPTIGASQTQTVAGSASSSNANSNPASATTSSVGDEPISIADAIALATANSDLTTGPDENTTTVATPIAYDRNPGGENYDRNPAGGANDPLPTGDEEAGSSSYVPWNSDGPAEEPNQSTGEAPPWDFDSYFRGDTRSSARARRLSSLICTMFMGVGGIVLALQ